MESVLRVLFEEQIEFHLRDGTAISGSIFIGETELLPVEVLREDGAAYRAEFNRWLDQRWLPEQAERRSEILKLHGNAKRYLDLKMAVARQQVIPLIGSGMSVPSGLPTWSELLRKVRTFTQIDAGSLDDLLSEAAFEEAADLLASAVNTKLLDERVEHELRVDERAVIDGPIRLLPAIFPSLAITTNLDDVLEHNYDACGLPFVHILAGKEVARYRQLRTPTESFLLKLHGDCRNAETRVLLTAEYEAAYAVGSITHEELSLLYRNNHILFLGCSLGPDRTVELVAGVANSDAHMPKHYAFLPLPDGDDVRVERENFLTERGIYPIWYDGPHNEAICALLAGLLDLDRTGNLSVE